MKGIVGRKLGMSQVFDEESGQVTPVTVIEAGPCPVVLVSTVETDGYEAVQLAFGPVSHGSHNVRKPGSIGASATPSRVFKGMKMAGRLGGKRVTQVGLTVHSVDPEQNLLLVKGAVPGPKNGIVQVREERSHGRS